MTAEWNLLMVFITININAASARVRNMRLRAECEQAPKETLELLMAVAV